MGTLADILSRFKDKTALKAIIKLASTWKLKKRRRQKETLETLRRYNSHISSLRSPSHDSRGLNTSSNEEFSKGEDI